MAPDSSQLRAVTQKKFSEDDDDNVFVLKSISNSFHQSCFMGQYVLHGEFNKSPYYKQCHDDDVKNSYYIYREKNKQWICGHKLGKPKSAELQNPSTSEHVPLNGWKILSYLELDDDEGSFVLTKGPLSVLNTITISGDEVSNERFSSYFGTFTRTRKWILGKPVMVNTEKKYLYYGSADWEWNNEGCWYISGRVDGTGSVKIYSDSGYSLLTASKHLWTSYEKESRIEKIKEKVTNAFSNGSLGLTVTCSTHSMEEMASDEEETRL